MRVVTNEATIQRNRRIGQISFLVSLVLLAGSFIFGNRLASSNEVTAFYFNCGVLPTLFVIILFSVRMANNWIREPVPWTAIQEALRGLSSNAVLYHFILPVRHVLLAPQGIFVLYPMFQDRQITVRDDRWRLGGGVLGSMLTFMRQEGVGNPARDAKLEAQYLQKLLDKRFPESGIEVQPVIVFTSPRAKVDVQGEPSVPITFASDAGQPGLKEYIKSLKDEKRPTLDTDQIDELDLELIYLPEA